MASIQILTSQVSINSDFIKETKDELIREIGLNKEELTTIGNAAGNAAFLGIRNYQESIQNASNMKANSDLISSMMARVEKNESDIKNMDKPDQSGSVGSELLKYFDNAKTGTEEYSVSDVLYRADNNFLQGLYLDRDEFVFYESSGLYGKSFV